MMKANPSLEAIQIAKSLKNQPEPKLVKEYVFTNVERQRTKHNTIHGMLDIINSRNLFTNLNTIFRFPLISIREIIQF